MGLICMKYKFSPTDDILKEGNSYYITTSKGIFKMNDQQYEFLNNFSLYADAERILSNYPSNYYGSLRELIEYCIVKKILIPETYVEKNPMVWISRVTKFSVPQYISIFIEKFVVSSEKK